MTLTRDELDAASRTAAFPDQTPYRSISVQRIAELAQRTGAGVREIEVAALENGFVPERYARNLRTFSPADQAALLRAQVGVVGLGGLGGTVTEILARMGVGRLTLIDGDRFEESNLNRQLLSSPANLGVPKAEAAAQRVAQVNAAVEVSAQACFLTERNAPELIAGCRVVVDCLDNLRTRFELEDACRRAGCPLVSAAVAGASGHVTAIFPEDRGLRLIYGEPQELPLKGAETVLGTVPYAVAFLASLECAEVAKILLGRGGLLRDRLLVADLAEGIIEVVNLR
ncbi:MAG: HesA/MoeB/ThiF family protein [Desulfobacterales bacterium]|jgi:molybdopterin/thiamine biosynthesis adenylyltransferase|nr:HesA/MoeB/ThiF family protein [Desulfobacterales bacterium]